MKQKSRYLEKELEKNAISPAKKDDTN